MNIPPSPAPGPISLAIPATPAPAIAPNAEPTIDDLIDRYRRLDAKIDEIKVAQKAQLEPYVKALDTVYKSLQAKLQSAGLQNVKSPHGTAYFSTTVSYGVEDPAAFRTWCAQSGNFELFENRVAKAVMDEFATTHGTLPPGIKVNSNTRLNIRS